MENFTEYTNLHGEVQGTALQSFTGFIRNFLMVVGICATATSFSVVVISHQLFANVSKAYRDAHGYDSETDEEEEKEKEGPFEDKYLDEYNDLGDREVDDNELITFKNDYDTEETPRGIVKFAYDKETTTFTYYSNTKDLPYNFLEAIARGYVVRRDCKKVLVDTKAVLTKAEELCKKEEEEEKERKLREEEVEAKPSGVFATFKRYTKASLTQKEVKKVPLIEEANRYAYRGTLIDFDQLFSTKPDPEEFEQLDYGTFKKLAADSEKKNS
jgi:hypothetical protein